MITKNIKEVILVIELERKAISPLIEARYNKAIASTNPT